MWFSRNGSYLAYFKFDDANVLIQAIPVYGPPNLKQWQYTRYDQIHYPKVQYVIATQQIIGLFLMSSLRIDIVVNVSAVQQLEINRWPCNNNKFKVLKNY